MKTESCERCHKGVYKLYALEIHARIKGWVCESCYFKHLESKRKKEEGKKEWRP